MVEKNKGRLFVQLRIFFSASWSLASDVGLQEGSQPLHGHQLRRRMYVYSQHVKSFTAYLLSSRCVQSSGGRSTATVLAAIVQR